MAIFANNYDTDVRSFVETAGVTDKNSQVQLGIFAREIKKLGLWSKTVCWPLRAGQQGKNIDATSGAPLSFGGLGNFNATSISNSPIYKADGMLFARTSSQRIVLPNNSFNTGNNACSIWAFCKNATIANRQIVLAQGNNNISTDAFTLESPGAVTSFDTASIAFTGIGNYASASTNYKGFLIGNTNLGFLGFNGGTVTSATLNNTLNKTGTDCSIASFGSPLSTFFDGTITAVIRIDEIPTTNLNSTIYALFKRSLGAGIAYP